MDVLGDDIKIRSIGLFTFVLYQACFWEWYHYALFSVLIILALELLSFLVLKVPSLFSNITNNLIPVKGKHLDNLSMKDISFITFNKLCTIVFTYHLLQFCFSYGTVQYENFEMNEPYEALLSSLFNKLSNGNAILFYILTVSSAFILFFIVYDFFYTLFHATLHVRGLYAWIHKHHHQQKAPSRGNNDAVNVSPIEFLIGEYNHLLTIFIVSHIIPTHLLTVLLFIMIGGIMASLNHTRYDINFPIFSAIYQVKYHDIHHFYPKANFGQYTMLWDHVFGWFRSYESFSKKPE
eukprot:TRINITY_DN1343_c2_g1_i1.p1 TRINITY_DN1343_c2_g1~~TRINITY_DN1343_c2_g1_i1.p1  ORF type:complete len:293 (-),score=22.05 TRINITY_DN1343_c2_g1_i1:223-1101(-)